MSLESDQKQSDMLFIAGIRGSIYLGEPCRYQRKNADGEACCSVGEYLNGTMERIGFSCKFLGPAHIPLVTDPILLELKDGIIKELQKLEEGETEFDRYVLATAEEIVNKLPTGIDSITGQFYARCRYVPQGILRIN